MIVWPPAGTRVAVRYRLPPGETPPLTDAIGELLATSPAVQVRTQRGALLTVAPSDVVAVRALPAVPVRTSQIRNLEHAAALAWPGVAQHWVDGWLLRFGHSVTRRANSAVPLAVWSMEGLPSVISWYATRGLVPWVAAPDRLLRLPAGAPVEAENVVMTCDVPSGGVPSVSISPTPSDDWLRIYERSVPVDVLTAVVDGSVGFAAVPDAAVGRAAVTTAPDGTRWVGVSAVRVDPAARRRGHARTLCAALLAWGAEHGATRAYVQVLADNAAGIALYRSMGFTEQHRVRYIDARTL